MENRRFSGDFTGNASSLIRLNSINIRSEYWTGTLNYFYQANLYIKKHVHTDAAVQREVSQKSCPKGLSLDFACNISEFKQFNLLPFPLIFLRF